MTLTLTDFHKHYVTTSKSAQDKLKKLSLFDSTSEEKEEVTALLAELIDMFRTAMAIGDIIAQLSPAPKLAEEPEEPPSDAPGK